MIKTSLFAAAGWLLVGLAPAAHADDRVRLVGGCPAIAERPDCPGVPPPPPAADYPHGAQPGQCFAQVRTPPVFETYQEQIVVSPGRVESRQTPAQYEWAERRVLVSPGREVRRWVPATYRSVTDTVVVSPATTRVEHIEPVFDTVYDQVMVRPPMPNGGGPSWDPTASCLPAPRFGPPARWSVWWRFRPNTPLSLAGCCANPDARWKPLFRR